MKQLYFLPLAMAGALTLTGCFDTSSTSDDFEDSNVRVIHASPDAPAVNITVDGDVVVEGADYKGVALLEQDSGTYSLGIDAVLPDDGTDTVLGPLDFTVEDDTRYEVIAVGSAAGETLDALVFDYPDEAYESDTDVRLRVAHLAEDAGDVDVYLSDPEDAVEIGTTEPNLQLAYTDLADSFEVPEGEYRIQVTAAGADEVVFDSGAISLDAGDDLLLGAVTNTGANADASPISLMVVDGGEVTEIYDAEQLAGVRVVHNSADAPDVDVYLNGELSPIVGLAFTEVAPDQSTDRYATLPVGTVAVQVTAADGAAEDAVIETDLELASGQGYTVIALGILDDIDVEVLEDNQRSIFTQASLRVVHGSTEAGNVDVYLLESEEPEAPIGNAEPILADVVFRDVSDYLTVTPGDYDIVVALADAGEEFRVPVTLEAGGVYTAIARDNVDEEGVIVGVAEDFILLDDSTTVDEAEAVGEEVDEAADEAEETIDDAFDDAEDVFDEVF